jgi:hypothetical protein
VSGTYLGLRGSEKRNHLISRVLVCAHVGRWGKNSHVDQRVRHYYLPHVALATVGRSG